jgi:hypothetical protein
MGFGGFGAARYRAQYEQAKKDVATLPKRTVTTEEFVRLSLAAGSDEDDARKSAMFCRTLGGHTRVGDEMLTVEG